MLTGRLELLAAALFLSTGGAAIKATDLDSWQVAGLRSSVAALSLFSLVARTRRRLDLPDALVATPYAATLVLYVTANKLTTAANAIFLQSTAPLYVLLASPLVLEERVEWRAVPHMAALTLGLVLFFAGQESPSDTAPDPVLGNAVAAASGVTWGLTLIGLRWLARAEREGSALPAIAWGNALASVACIPGSWSLSAVQARDLLLVLYLGGVQIALAYVLIDGGFRHVRAPEGTFLLLLEPVLNPVWAWWFHAERPSNLALGGGAIVLAAVTALSLRSLQASPAARGG